MLWWLFEYCKRTSRWHAKQHEAWGCVGSRRAKEREIPCFYDISAKKRVKDCPKNHWQSQHVLDTRTHPCGSEEKHDGDLLLNEFSSIILKIKSCLLPESNGHPSNEPLKVVKTKQAYSESNQDHYFWNFTVLLFKRQDFL